MEAMRVEHGSMEHALDLNALRTLRTVARQGSFTAAAAVLGYTQSAISRQASALESAAGCALFERLSRGVRLTPAGLQLLGHAEAVLARLDIAQGELEAIRGLKGGQLRIGSVPSAAETLVPESMACFHTDYPLVRLSITTGLPMRMLDDLRVGDLDIAIFTSDPQSPLSRDELDVTDLGKDPMLVALPIAHPLARRKRLDLADLASEAWIEREDSEKAKMLRVACSRLGFQPLIEVHATTMSSQQSLVAAGVGITLVPALASTIREDIALLRLEPGQIPARQVHAVTGIIQSPPVKPFLAFLQERFRQHHDALRRRTLGA